MLVTDAWLLVAAILLRLEKRPAPSQDGPLSHTRGLASGLRRRYSRGAAIGTGPGKTQPSIGMTYAPPDSSGWPDWRRKAD